MNRAAPGGVVWVDRQQGDVEKVTRMTCEDHVREVYDASYGRLVVQFLALIGDLAGAEDASWESRPTCPESPAEVAGIGSRRDIDIHRGGTT